MNVRNILFGSTETRADLGLLVLRVGFGLTLAFGHGLGKLPPSDGFVANTASLGFPLPVLFAWAAALSEFAGGLLVAVGLLTRPAALFVAITMSVAFFVQHGADPFSDKELAFVFLIWAVGMLLTGPGRYSVDARLAPQR